MRLKVKIPLLITPLLLALLLVPLTLAAGPKITPLDQSQSQPRVAYQAIFANSSAGGRVHWSQATFAYDGQAYPPGTIYAPDGLPGDGFDSVVVSGALDTRPALALDTAGTQVAVFRSTLSDDYGAAAWELADVRETFDSYLWGALDYDILDEAALAETDLSGYALLILPSVRWGNEAEVLALLDETARANIKQFVENGGFLYAQSNGAIIAEAAGLLAPGTVALTTPLTLAAGEPPNTAQMEILDPASPLTFSWLTNTLYLLTDPTFRPDETLATIAEFSNLAGEPQPAILSGEVGRGRVILVAGHPTAPSRRAQLPLFFNAIFWAAGHPAELFGDAIQVYNPDLDPHLLPAYEPGAPISYSLTFANLWDSPMHRVTITETVAGGLNVLPATITPPPAQVIPQTNPTQTLVVWQFETVPPGEIDLGFVAETGQEVLAKGEITVGTGAATYTLGECLDGGTGCLPTFPGSGALPAGFHSHTVHHQPFQMASRMAARLMLDRDLEADRQFHIPADGLLLDVTVPIENKEETLASQVVITDVVLLIAPIVDLEDQETILDQNNGQTIWIANEPFFYDETGGPYLPADGYQPGDQITLADWTGELAAFDVPYGAHDCTNPQQRGLGNCVTIPVTYSQYITITADHKLLLPVKTLTWQLGDWPGYHYAEPALRYGLHSRELLSRTVTFAGAPGIVPEDVVIQGTGGSIYTHLGDYPIFYRDHLAQGLVYVPQAPLSSTVTYRDIWSRTHTVPLRAAFYDVFDWASCAGCGPWSDRHAAVGVTFGMQADMDGDGTNEEILLYPGRSEGADLDIVIKDKALLSAIPAEEMLVDLGVFHGLGVNIGPRYETWEKSWTANVPGTLEVTSTLAYDRLYFQHAIPADGTTVLTVAARIDGYPDLNREGMIKLHDGARFTYRQQIAGPSRYEVTDSHVQGVLGAAPEITIRKQGTPILISTYGDTLYYVISLDDPHDPRQLVRNGRGDPFLQSYGFTDLAATTYLGGKEGRQILHSLVRPGEWTRLRVEVNNNTATDFTSVVVDPQPPAGITVQRTYTDNLPAPIFPDLPFLYLEKIPEAERGVYYFDLFVSPDYAGPRGQVIDIPIAFSADGAPSDFRIPPAQLGIEDEAGQVYQVYGKAATLALTDTLPPYVEPLSAALVSAADVTALSAAADEAERAALFAGFEDVVSYTTTADQIDFALPGHALDRLYDPAGDHQLFVVLQGAITPPAAGPTLANDGAWVSYSDEQGAKWAEQSEPLLVEVHGAAVRADYTCLNTLPDARPARLFGEGESDPSTCLLEAGSGNQVTLQVTLFNAGDYIAENLTTTMTLPAGIEVVGSTPQASVDGQTVTWTGLGDLAPGSQTSLELVVYLTLDDGGDLEARGQAAGTWLVQVVDWTNGRFFDRFSQQTIEARLADEYQLPTRLDSRKPQAIYLPLVTRTDPLPDLVVTGFTIDPPDLVTGQPARVAVEVTNRGGIPSGPFWVDFYISPDPVPAAAGLRWNDACGVDPCDGLAWAVEALGPGQSLILTSDPGSFTADQSTWSGAFRVSGQHDFYVYVDSWNGDVPHGAVREVDEGNNRADILDREITGGDLTAGQSAANPNIAPRQQPGQ